MSAARHDEAALIAEAEASEHAGRYDPEKTTTRTAYARDRSWSVVVNPTSEHLEDAAQLRLAATEHRNAAAVLRASETQACAAPGATSGGLTSFFKPGSVERVQPAYGYGRVRSVMGATIVLATAPGLSAAAVQRDLDCHLARNAVAGFESPEMSFCPLAGKGVRAQARESDGRVVVEIRGDDRATVDEVLRRARLLVP